MGFDPTSSRSGGECLVRLAIKAFLKERATGKYLIIKLTKKKDQKWDPLSGPTFWSHFLRRSRKNRKGIKTGNKNIPGRDRSDVLSIRSQARYALGRGGFMLIKCKNYLI